MITVNELRIGNWVIHDNSNLKIESIHEDGVNLFYSEGNPWGCPAYVDFNYKFNDLTPIPLTEEILLKSEFRKSNDKLLFLPLPLLSMEVHAVLFRGEWLIELHNDRKGIVTEVYKLHQLQNLVHSLTNKELNITL
jgi:hypothetical protein